VFYDFYYHSCYCHTCAIRQQQIEEAEEKGEEEEEATHQRLRLVCRRSIDRQAI